MLRRIYDEFEFMEEFEVKKVAKLLFIISITYTILFTFWFIIIGLILTLTV